MATLDLIAQTNDSTSSANPFCRSCSPPPDHPFTTVFFQRSRKKIPTSQLKSALLSALHASSIRPALKYPEGAAAVPRVLWFPRPATISFSFVFAACGGDGGGGGLGGGGASYSTTPSCFSVSSTGSDGWQPRCQCLRCRLRCRLRLLLVSHVQTLLLHRNHHLLFPQLLLLHNHHLLRRHLFCAGLRLSLIHI